MSEPFKNLIHPGTVRLAGQHVARVWPAFDRARFEALALPNLHTLELKARAMRLADALQATLPADFGHAADVIEATLAPVPAPTPAGDRAEDEPDLAALVAGEHGLAGWVVWGPWAKWWPAWARPMCRAHWPACAS